MQALWDPTHSVARRTLHIQWPVVKSLPRLTSPRIRRLRSVLSRMNTQSNLRPSTSLLDPERHLHSHFFLSRHNSPKNNFLLRFDIPSFNPLKVKVPH